MRRKGQPPMMGVISRGEASVERGHQPDGGRFPLLRQLVYGHGLRRLEYRQAAARLTGLPALDREPEALASPQVRALVERVGPQRCLAHLFVPLEEGEDYVKALVADPTSASTEEALRQAFGPKRQDKVVGTDLDVARLVTALERDRLLRYAVESLDRVAPDMSARMVLRGPQRAVLAALLLGMVAAAVVWPHFVGVAIILALNAVFLALGGGVLILVLAGIHYRLTKAREAWRPPSGRRDWPIYTVLVPMYREPPHVVRQLVHNLSRLDYPKDRLDVILLLEDDDEVTVRSCKEVQPPGFMRIVTVPPSWPRTKPKALNWGLLFAQGEYLTVYDAEDAPEPDQLKRAVLHFERTGEEVACVQAALNFYNARHNLLTRLFALEYSMWFDNVIPGLRHLGMAFPLGGTSNHLRTAALRAVGGWDPFNVTEDADLGFRLQRMGYRAEFLPSTTYEEASSRPWQWLKQRSRWVKGYMMTWLVHARHPLRLLREVGLRPFLSFNILIGGSSLAFLAYIPLYLLTFTSLLLPQLTDVLYPGWARLGMIAVWATGIFAAILASALGIVIRRWWWLLPFAILMPLYWVLHSCAAWWALYELVFRPHYWQRTPHGLAIPEQAFQER
jgi:cellulose synthase/poly-beta-1,6-N-acetylglucosamine synthase-like glycosyltransferase